MSVLLLNDQTILGFINDKEAFGGCAGERFHELDVDGDGLISREELRWGFGSGIALDAEGDAEEGTNGPFDAAFDRCDGDKDGALGPGEFRGLVEEIMRALAQGIGRVPVSMVLQEGSLFVKAVEHELEQR